MQFIGGPGYKEEEFSKMTEANCRELAARGNGVSEGYMCANAWAVLVQYYNDKGII